MQKRKLFGCILILLGLSIFTRCFLFNYPTEVVFDEFYFGKFVKAYQTGEYYFDIHPPLGKLLVAGAAHLGGVTITDEFGAIGQSLTSEHMIVLRLLPLLAGIALPLIIFAVCRYLNLSLSASFLAGLLIILENSILVQSRFILLDELLLAFGFSALLLYLMYRQSQKLYLVILAGVFAGMAVSIKWTGLSFTALIGIVELIDVYRKRISLRKTLRNGVMVAGIMVFVYITSFAIHFALLKQPGEGDAFMVSDFQQNSFVSKFIDINATMFTANQQDLQHQYGSRWYTWPTMQRGVFYWQKFLPDAEARIYYLGNPFIYWLSALAILVLILGLYLKTRAGFIIVTGYLLNFLPYILIGRVMFLYHYQAALIFGIIGIAYLVHLIPQIKAKRIALVSIALVSLAGFIYMAPLSYGIPLQKDQLQSHFWFKSWE